MTYKNQNKRVGKRRKARRQKDRMFTNIDDRILRKNKHQRGKKTDEGKKKTD